MNVFRTDTENDFLINVIGKNCFVNLGLREFNVELLTSGSLGVFGAEFDSILAIELSENGINKVHLRRTHEACNKEVYRICVEVLRRINLLNEAVLHNNDSVTHCHSFCLVMSNVDKCCTELLVELGDLSSHLSTELSVEVGKRLVEEEYLRLTNDSTTESNTLSLTAGESLWLSVEEVRDVEDTSSFFNLTADFVLRNLSELKTESHILEYSHVRIKSIVLENHCDVSVLRSNVVYKTVADVELTFRDLFKTCDHTESCGLTTTGWTYKDDKFLILDFQINVGNGYYAAWVFLID